MAEDQADYFAPKALLSPPTKRAAYSDRTAWIMAKLSALVYVEFEETDAQMQELVNKLRSGSFELVCALSVIEGSNDTQAMLVRRPDLAVLVFRGTKEKADIRTDLSAKFVDTPEGKAHKGFISAYETVHDEFVAKIEEKIPADLPLYVTGHSLGGALATAAANRLDAVHTLAACYTFGSPRIGTEEWGDRIKTPVYRVVNAADGVPLIPLSGLVRTILKMLGLGFVVKAIGKVGFIGYQHVGDIRYLTVDSQLVIGSAATMKRLMRLIVNFLLGLIRFKFRILTSLIYDHFMRNYVAKLEKIARERNLPSDS